MGAYPERASSTPFRLSSASQLLAGLDLPARVTVQISESDPHLSIPTGIRGSIPPGTVRLILGKSGLNLTAATAKSLQSCPTLCDPIPGILQARTLEWVAISFSNA